MERLSALVALVRLAEVGLLPTLLGLHHGLGVEADAFAVPSRQASSVHPLFVWSKHVWARRLIPKSTIIRVE